MINLIAALPAEVNPLKRHFSLEPTHTTPFRIYQNNSIRLILSGIGKQNAARAVSFLKELAGAKDEAWLNVGIAGHRNKKIGTGVLAHKITDAETQENWYPALTFHPPCSTGMILTVERAESRYENPYVYDMEASGFYESALRSSTVELVHCYKIISDNAESSHQSVTPRLAEQLIEGGLKDVSFLISELRKHVELLNSLKISPEELAPFLKQWHFTVTQQFQLQRLLRRLKTLTSSEINSKDFTALRNSDQVLAALRDQLRQIPVRL